MTTEISIYTSIMITLGWWRHVSEIPGRHLAKKSHQLVDCCRVLTRVACDVVVPKSHRPREGVLFFQVELTPLASSSFDVGSRSVRCICNNLGQICVQNCMQILEFMNYIYVILLML